MEQRIFKSDKKVFLIVCCIYILFLPIALYGSNIIRGNVLASDVYNRPDGNDVVIKGRMILEKKGVNKRMEVTMKKLKQLENAYGNPDFRYVSLTTVGSNDHVQGYLVYDFFTNDGYFFGYDLSDSNGGAYVLWLLNHQRKVISSATIDVNTEGVGAATIALPTDLDELYEIVVSLEAKLPAETPSTRLEMRAKASL